MISAIVCRCLFLFTFLQSVSYIHLVSHSHNNAYVQDDNDKQYILDTIPASLRKDFSEIEHETRNAPVIDIAYDALSYIKFEPNILDFDERQLGIPHQETVTILNKHNNRTIQLFSISGNTRQFHSSFFQEKVISPLGNTTFKVVYLGRDESEIDTFFYIQTSEGTIKYRVKGKSVSSLYRLRPLVEAKIPINSSFTPLIYMYNPRAEPMQVMEVYSSGGEFQLELPSGEAEGSKEMWEIAPYQTKPVIRLRFNAYAEKNHTAYIRFKVNNSAEVLVVAVEIQVGNSAGLHWAGNTEIINFGMGGSMQSPTHYPITLKNSAKKPIKVANIISTPVSKALKINFKPITIPADTDVPIAVGSLIYDWKTGLDLQEFNGKLTIKGVGPNGSAQKIAIPWIAQVFHGGLEVVNATLAHFCSPHLQQSRNFSVINKFKLPLAISNVSLPVEAASHFSISNFIPKILKPGQKDKIFSLSLNRSKRNEQFKLESSILIHTNVSTTKIPLLRYDGKLKKIIPDARKSDKGALNFGTVSSGTQNEAVFALENQNPVNVDLLGWGVNMPGAVLELTGCQNGPKELFDKGYRNITACSSTGNQSIKPGFLAVFQIKVKTPEVEDDTIVGDVFVKTTYERLKIPVHMRVAFGRIIMKKQTFVDCFPGLICAQEVKVHSTFAKPMEVTYISPVNKDNRVKYIPLKETGCTISKGDNSVGSIVIDPSVSCEPQCYLGFPLNTSVGTQWLNTLSLPSHTRHFDLNLLNARYLRYLNSTGGESWDNITMQLDTTEVRGYKFHVNIKPSWPSLLANGGILRNKSLLLFPLTQVGNTTYKKIRLHNPSSSPLYIHLTMDWSYPQGMRLYESLPDKFKVECTDCASVVSSEFKLEDSDEDDRREFEQTWGVTPAPHSLTFILQPAESRIVRLSYTPTSAVSSSALVYIRNNITILEVFQVSGRGAVAQFKFGNRKPGSTTPLLFELTEKHLRDCVDDPSLKKPGRQPKLTVKRSFAARNTGELPITVYGFFVNELACSGYGFKVLNCEGFMLLPNATRKVDIAFTPDFTMSLVERELVVLTSVDGDLTTFEQKTLDNVLGAVRLDLLATVPMPMLHKCAQVVPRPTWEPTVQSTLLVALLIMMVCVFVVSFFEADRILKLKVAENRFTLDFRQIVANSKNPVEEKTQKNKKEEVVSTPDWKRNKDKMKPSPDWNVEEERKFKEENPPVKKKTTRKQPVVEVENSESKEEKKNAVMNGNLSRKTKTETCSAKEEYKLPVDEVSHPSVTETQNNIKESNHKADQSKKKQYTSGYNSEVQINNANFKKFDNNTSHKVAHYSEEETSSTTTEGSAQEEIAATTTSGNGLTNKYKDYIENAKVKDDKHPRKLHTKKSKPVSSIPAGSTDFKDNYEGDCDDDEYDKEKPDNSNRWKTSTARTNIKQTNYHQLSSPTVSDTNCKPTHVPKQGQKKEKNPQKRRSDKIKNKTQQNQQQMIILNGASSSRDETKSQQFASSVPSTISAPPPSYWGENRAKFSDVVARNQDPTGSYKLNKSYAQALPKSYISEDKKNLEINNSEAVKDSVVQKDYKLGFKGPHGKQTSEKDLGCFGGFMLPKTSNDLQAQNSFYFSNSYPESMFERELVPYDDLPETDEVLMELEYPNDENTCHGLWQDNGTPLNAPSIATENATSFHASSNSVETSRGSNSTETIRDNWVTIDPNWEPLYNRGAVGEERSGVWGLNRGVWSATPWGAPSTPAASARTVNSLPQTVTTEYQEQNGFDPFHSLRTIWTPSAAERWKPKGE